MMDYTSSSDDDELQIESLDFSNDIYYRPIHERLPQVTPRPPGPPTKPVKSASIPKYGSKKIRHALPAYDLWKPFYPTYLNETKFRNFHRPKLRHYNNGPQSSSDLSFPIKSLSRHMHRSNMELKDKVLRAIDDNLSREQIIEKFHHIRQARSLTAKTGGLYLFEYCEEYPTVLSQVGMASNVITYRYNPAPSTTSRTKTPYSTAKNNQTGEPPQIGIADDHAVTASRDFGYTDHIKADSRAKKIYFHQLRPNSSIRVIENNLYRAPVFEQNMSSCDFVIIRTRNSFYIRSVDGIFTVGQTMPLTVVPSPTEPQIQKFRCDLSNVHIHKLFKTSNTKPPSLDMRVLLKMFPDYHEKVLKKRLTTAGAELQKSNRKVSAYYRHADQQLLYIQGSSNYGSVSLLELRNMLKPEYYCLNMTMLAARQRLRELNYSESMINPQKGQAVEMEPEVLAAPWNTSKAVISALRGQAYLDLKTHLVDPTGAREGFSCVSWPKSTIADQQHKDSADPKMRSSLNFQQPLLKNPLHDKIIQEKLNRLATYQREAQSIFEIQANALAIKEDITSDEDDGIDAESENISDSGFDRDFERLNKLVIENRSTSEVNYEEEEIMRREMLSEINNRPLDEGKSLSPRKKVLADLNGKILMISREYKYGDNSILRTEIVREPKVIARYVQLRGGTVNSESGRGDLSKSVCDGDKHNMSAMSSKSAGTVTHSRIRSRSTSLGPSELCRAEGTILRISKKVLEGCRPMRDCRR